MFRKMLCSFIVLTLTAGATLGCGGGGPNVGKVSGTVTIDGKPASGITVSFQPSEGGRGSSGTTDQNGNYELIHSPTVKGALVGSHNATIAAGEPGVDTPMHGNAALIQASGFPSEYSLIKKPVTVEAGRNTIDLTFP